MKHFIIFGLLLALVNCRIIENVGENPNLPVLDYQPAVINNPVVAEAIPHPTPNLHMFDDPLKKKKVLSSYPAVTESEEAFVLTGILKASSISRFGTRGCPALFRPVCAGRRLSKYWPPVTFKNDCELYMFNKRNWGAELKILFADECENWPDKTFEYWTEQIAFPN